MIGNRLKSLRENLGKEQWYIADKLGIARNTYTEYETNHITPSIKSLSFLAHLYNTNLDYILGLSNNKQPYGKICSYNKEKFLKNIKLIRTNLHYTQSELANIISCHRVTIARYENGITEIQIDYLIKLSKLTEIPTDYIVGIINKKL